MLKATGHCRRAWTTLMQALSGAKKKFASIQKESQFLYYPFAFMLKLEKVIAVFHSCNLRVWSKRHIYLFLLAGVPVKLAKISYRQNRNDIENFSEPPPKHVGICYRVLIQNFRKDYLLFGMRRFPWYIHLFK